MAIASLLLSNGKFYNNVEHIVHNLIKEKIHNIAIILKYLNCRKYIFLLTSN